MPLKYFLAKVGEYVAKVGNYAAMVAKDVPFEPEAIAQDFWGLDNYYPSEQGRYNYIIWDDGLKANISANTTCSIFNVITMATESITQTTCGKMYSATITFVCESKCKIRNYLRSNDGADSMTLEDSSGTIIDTYNLSNTTTPIECATIVEAGRYTLRVGTGNPYWHGANIVTEE